MQSAHELHRAFSKSVRPVRGPCRHGGDGLYGASPDADDRAGGASTRGRFARGSRLTRGGRVPGDGSLASGVARSFAGGLTWSIARCVASRFASGIALAGRVALAGRGGRRRGGRCSTGSSGAAHRLANHGRRHG